MMQLRTVPTAQPSGPFAGNRPAAEIGAAAAGVLAVEDRAARPRMRPIAAAERTRPAEPGREVGLWRLYRWGWRLLSGSRWHIAGAAALTLLVAQVAQFNAALLVHAVALAQDRGGAAGMSENFFGLMPKEFGTTVAVFAVISFSLFGLQFVSRYATAAINAVLSYRIQEKLHRKMLRLGVRYHTVNKEGALQKLFTQRVPQSVGVLRELLVAPVTNGIALVTASLYLWGSAAPLIGRNNGAATAVVVVLLIALLIAATRIARAMRAARAASMAADNAVGDELANTLRRPIDFQLLGAQAARNEAFAARIGTALGAELQAERRKQWATLIQSGMPQFFQTGILLLAAVLVQFPAPGERFAVAAAMGAAIVGILQFVPMALAPIQQALSFYNAAKASVPAIVTVIAALDAEEEVPEAEDAVPLRVTKGTVTLAEVSVESDDAVPILRAITHEFVGGKVWGVVGRSGCGKSTLISLIARAADPSCGRICIDGTDVRRVERASLRRAIAFLGQFSPFVDGPVRANLNLALSPASDEVLLEACRAGGLLARLQDLAGPLSPLDLEISAEPNKGALSGGERRLLALARLLAHPAPIILLDEPTAGVDAAMRGQIAALIRARPAGATVIVVDHDLGFISEIADAVVCMKEGAIVASVARAELFDKPTPFLDLWRAQQHLSGEAMAVTSFPAPSA
ncbi:MAG: ATP-binding cassette domain-containing protein [Stellaceae bacterium]